MIKFFGSKNTVVEFVNALLRSSNVDWQQITITNPEKYADSSVSIVINTLSEDTVKELGEIYFTTL